MEMMADTHASSRNGLEIAVIGMAGRFPSADDVDALWELLKAGREGFVELSDDELREAGVDPALMQRPDYVRRRGFVGRKHAFDAVLMGYTAQDAATMDPQLQVLHEVVWTALENAAYDPGKFEGLIGLFAGASSNLAWMRRVAETGGSLADWYNVAGLNEPGYLCTRVANKLDLTGPAITVNTTCSTSLVNIHLACQSLLTGECDIALAGGVSVNAETRGYLYQENMVLSPDGVCRPFDATANGTGSGEGCGVLVLRRLDDALADNDTIVAVIKGSAINNDGQRKAAFTAPSAEGQARVIRSALDRAEVRADSIGYVEAHGTATRLGDPIEVAALKRVFDADGARDCAIGSVKSNLGHLGEAAGVTGAIKAILMLRHGTLVPSLHFSEPNPLIGLASGPFHVNTQTRPWTQGNALPRRAGVSSFGIGGTNAHVVLEEAPASAAAALEPAAEHLILLSAASPAALRAREHALADYARHHPQASLADIAFTLHVGRKDLRFRKAFVARCMADLVEPVRVSEGQAEAIRPGICFMFPGQGAQYLGMARDLYGRDSVFRTCIDRCLELARQHTDAPLLDMLLARSPSSPDIQDTAIAQPLLFFVEYALACQLEAWGYHADAFIGHSVGEYVAACLAGVFTLENAVSLVITRGRLMSSVRHGAMLAVPLAASAVRAVLGEGLEIAAINGADRVVVAGDADAIEALRSRLAADDVQTVVLATSHAFHSAHMEPVLEAFRDAVSRAHPTSPSRPFVSNLTGTWIRDDEAASPDYWAAHLRGTVRFADGLAALCAEPGRLLVEVGPGRSLCGLVARQNGSATRVRTVALLPSASRRVEGDDLASVLRGVGELYMAGAAPDPIAWHEGTSRHRIPLPTYPFDGETRRLVPLAELGTQGRSPASMASEPGAQADAGTTVAISGMTSTQSTLVAIWKKYLGADEVGLHDDVFDLGVDSLLSIRVITEIRETFAAELSLDTIFVMRTVAEQAAEIERRIGGGDARSIPSIRRYDHGGRAPLSASQRRLWIISQLEGDRTAYNTGFCEFVTGIDADVLERAVHTVIERHAILRTVYTEVDGVPIQHVRDDFTFRLDRGDLRHIDPTARRDAGDAMWQAALEAPIDLRADLMLRVALVRYDETSYLLMVTQHHICSDNWSNNVLMHEIGTLYDAYAQGLPDPLPPLPVQYIDYAMWQDEWLRGQVLDEQIPYWRKTLEGIPTVHNLPLDHPRPKYQSYRGKQYTVSVDGEVLDGLQRVAKQGGATLFMAMQAAFSVFLGRYSGESDIVLGFSVANRLQKELEGLIGFFVNALVLRSDLSDNPSFTDFLGQVKRNLLGAYAHPHVPFEVLVDELRPARSMSYEPIIQVKLIYLDQSQDQGGRGLIRARADQREAVTHADMQVPFSKYDLTLYFSVVDDALSLTWEYATDLFEASTVHRMARNFETLLRSIVATPYETVRKLRLLDDGEMARQRLDGNIADLPAADRKRTRAATDFNFSLFYFASDAGDQAPDKYRLLIDGARFADRSGFDAVWMPERHFDAFGGVFPNPAITAAAVASMTHRVHVRAGSCVLPLHHPVRVAEDWSVIDNISNGRVGIGFAAGYSARDFSLAPDHFETRRDVLLRDVATVKALWRGESITLPNGKGEPTEIRIRPRPIQDELPVWVTTVGNEDAFRHAGRNGDNILTHLMGQSLDELARKITVYREEWLEAGHPGQGTISLLVHTFVAETEQMVLDHVREPFKKYLVDSVGTPQAIAKTLGLGDIGAAGAGQSDIEAITEFAFQRYYQSNALLGTAERCMTLVAAIRAAGVNEVACLIDFGVDHALVLDSLPRLRRLRDMAIPDVDFDVDAESVAMVPGEGSLAQAAHPISPCIHELFAERAASDPDAVAVVYGDDSLTYGELDRMANRVAWHLLREHGACPEVRIGLCLERSIWMIVGWLGILKAGSAYVPMEPGNPPERLAHMIADAGLTVVLTRQADRACLDEVGVTSLVLDGGAFAADEPVDAPDTGVHAANAAYVIYTSGSTGAPKGVVVEHRSAVNFWEVMRNGTHAGLAPGSRVGLNASFAFDMSLKGLLQLLSGHVVQLIPQAIRADGVRLLAFVREQRIEVLDSTPSQLDVLLAAGLLDGNGWQPARVLLGGEPINEAMWATLRGSTRTRFFNMYGPTECTIDATIGEIGPTHDVPHIGRPIAQAQVYLLDEFGQPVPRGATGEIHVGGLGVARGYLGQPALTSQRFIPDPHRPGDATARLYRTGDLGRWLDDGHLAYLGRNDLQVKLRGFRVELGEIESRLCARPGVRQAAVLAAGEGSARYLVAYLVIAEGAEGGALVEAVKREMTSVLPNYMLPQAYVILPVLPLNANGKLDRDALARHTHERPQHDYVAPQTPTEKILVAIWSELMSVDRVGIRDNFFELGGQSLVAIRAINEIGSRLEVELETRFIFEYSTVESLAAHIDNILWMRDDAMTADTMVGDEEVDLEI
ncbi:non-ribosomal peptide synthetase/type I polyketide synthase [Luteibacter sp. dw_328]|uniref:non-ribosomal peptide synthetase/type I polyketide synthase n=1 Tax=Luteibacter sp. dw_328 TaxID=2719796 RepID=UPI001BD5720A|nr:non-ribosomal peptide synthetase/type I polyketide synthase [Luteibacter sp. dw_328]